MEQIIISWKAPVVEVANHCGCLPLCQIMVLCKSVCTQDRECLTDICGCVAGKMMEEHFLQVAQRKQIWPMLVSVHRKLYFDVHQLHWVSDCFQSKHVAVLGWPGKTCQLLPEPQGSRSSAEFYQGRLKKLLSQMVLMTLSVIDIIISVL